MSELSLSFIDTSAWCAFLNDSDRNHSSAVRELTVRQPETLITTTHVANELSRLVYAFDDFALALRFAVHVWRGDFAYVLDPDRRLVQNAWENFKLWRGRGASYVDCISAAVVSEYQIDSVIAYGSGLRVILSADKYQWTTQTGSDPK